MEDFLVDNGNRRWYRGRVSLFWVNFITTSRRDRNLESWWIYKGNHPQMAARFRLVTYYILPRYVCILGLTHMYAYTYMCMHICISVYMGLYSVLWLMDDVCIYIHILYTYTHVGIEPISWTVWIITTLPATENPCWRGLVGMVGEVFAKRRAFHTWTCWNDLPILGFFPDRENWIYKSNPISYNQYIKWLMVISYKEYVKMHDLSR